MDERLTTLFVLPTGNTLPTTGTNANLTASQFGIFLPNQSPATILTAASAKYLFFSQGRNVYTRNEGTKNSDFIYADNLIKWYKIPGNLQASSQITVINNWNSPGCQEDVSVTIRLDSYYIRQAYFNGLTRSVMVTTPCCSCGSNPCDTISGAALTTVLEELAQSINSDEILSQYVTAGTNTAGDELVIQGIPLTVYGTTCDLTNFPYMYDAMRFWTFVRTGPELTTDYEVTDICNLIATPVTIQSASYAQNTPAEVQQMEKNYWSYQSELNNIFSNPNFNGEFQTYVDSALAYDLYYLIFKEPLSTAGEPGLIPDNETVILAIPSGDTNEATTIAVLTAAFGPADNETSTPSTTSTFTTSSTTTSTTTVPIFPN